MTPEQHDEFLDALDNALECAIRRHRALHHASLAELMEMQKEVTHAREALEKVLKDQVEHAVRSNSFEVTPEQSVM